MATVRKRKLPSGLIRWQVSYVDGGGNRRAKLFDRKSDAEAWLVDTRHDVARGLHTPAAVSPTVSQASALWLKRCNEKQLERTTVRSYEEHVELHIKPFVGAKKLAELTAPTINAFADKLREEGRSPEMVRRVIRSLGGIFREARRRGLCSVDPTVGIDLHLPNRDDPRPIIPTKPELQAIIGKAGGHWRPLVLVAIFCGLRGSELRGLRWSDVDFDAREIHVRQRADAFHKIGRLKSKSGYRSIPMTPIVVNALREWKLTCPRLDTGKKDVAGTPITVLDLVFPTGKGKCESHSNIVQRGFEPIQMAAGVTEIRPVLDAAGNPVKDAAGSPKMAAQPKYGLHALRHAAASLWIEQGLNPKRIQTLMGHSTIQMTFDTYGHLFKDTDADQRAAEDIQARLLGS
ncbi:tyrosine-type recombinase/integrase [Bradyrhizobium sp. GCM10027634]|uniref:tyrosine-type recombinase/integrase n=1 Tax=unclassified Bradyrhizobium TaxID=2631580 RepID=UPI00263ACAD6|nr:site-specific integrase [Bradyrhizobium sp. WYCCWR 12677]MDN5003990.1 site-specific integrase [Bradyrhizobium sp. WYCCWR 12677]